MKKLALILTLFLSGCAITTVSEIEACHAILDKADNVQFSTTDHPDTIDSTGELLFVIEEVCPRR
jgi:hypothetical protein